MRPGTSTTPPLRFLGVVWLTAGLLALVPGYGETLRINGRLRVHDDIATLDVEEAFLHCAKAIMRSDLWTAQGAPGSSGSAEVACTWPVWLCCPMC